MSGLENMAMPVIATLQTGVLVGIFYRLGSLSARVHTLERKAEEALK